MANEPGNNAGKQHSQQPQQPQRSEFAYSGSNELTVEMANSRLGPVMFNPLKVKLRSRFQKGNMTRDEHVEVTDMLPDQIPGQRITLNIRERKAVIFDPLEMSEHRETLERITLANKTRGTQGPSACAHARMVYENLTNSDIKTWLYEIRKLLDHAAFYSAEWRDNPRTKMGGPLAIVIDGKIPPRQEIEKMPGDLKCNFFSNSHTEIRVRKMPVEEAAI